jgi:hypothetical protein
METPSAAAACDDSAPGDSVSRPTETQGMRNPTGDRIANADPSFGISMNITPTVAVGGPAVDGATAQSPSSSRAREISRTTGDDATLMPPPANPSDGLQ